MTKSTGVGRGRKPTHGHSHRGAMSPTYNSWRGMITRCDAVGQYGKLGIFVCERWRVFANFLEDMGERPKGHEIDRMDPLRIYEPSNCQWLPMRTNRQYRRTTRLDETCREVIKSLQANGLSQRKIAEALGVSRSCVQAYLSGRAWA